MKALASPPTEEGRWVVYCGVLSAIRTLSSCIKHDIMGPCVTPQQMVFLCKPIESYRILHTQGTKIQMFVRWNVRHKNIRNICQMNLICSKENIYINIFVTCSKVTL